MSPKDIESIATQVRTRVAPIALSALLVALPLRAQETNDVHQQDVDKEGRVTVLELGVAGDGTGASGFLGSIDVPIGASDTLSGAVGRTTFDDITVRRPGGQNVVVEQSPADRISLGYRHGFDSIGLNFGAERWGNSDQLQIDDLTAGLDYETERSDWSLDLVRRSATVTLIALPGGPHEGDVDAWGLDGGFSYITNVADVYLNLTYFDYGTDLDAGPLAARLGNSSALSVADSLIERGALIGARHLFNNWSLGMEAGWYRSGIASTETDTLAAIARLPLSKRMDLSVTLGGVKSPNEPTTAYGTLSMRFVLGGGA